ncbi:MAG: tRNA pseudouridine(38-40) synthase TruA [Bacteroidota bacterium]
MRYFAELAYSGTPFHGWQRQPRQVSVQSTIEEALSVLLRQEIEIVGCGRTDAGVHARQYFIHFDSEEVLHEKFVHRINKFLPPDISFRHFQVVEAKAHARYDAYYRRYAYYLDLNKNPFQQHTAFYYHFADQLDTNKLQQAAQLLLSYQDFFPFCKSNSDLKNMTCQLHLNEWEFNTGQYIFHIAANRFLRGMVRLIVGMCLNVGLGKLELEEVKFALDEQRLLSKSWSVPPQGLFLEEIRYPFLEKASASSTI